MIEGPPPADARFAVVAARFNDLVVDRLLDGALAAFRRHGFTAVDVARVPGAFELPLVAQTLAKTGRYAAVVCLGCVIQGDTDHYDHVCAAATSGIMTAGMSTDVPVIFGVLTCDTLEQALHRAGGKLGNKGAEAAAAAVETAGVLAAVAGGG